MGQESHAICSILCFMGQESYDFCNIRLVPPAKFNCFSMIFQNAASKSGDQGEQHECTNDCETQMFRLFGKSVLKALQVVAFWNYSRTFGGKVSRSSQCVLGWLWVILFVWFAACVDSWDKKVIFFTACSCSHVKKNTTFATDDWYRLPNLSVFKDFSSWCFRKRWSRRAAWVHKWL